MNTVLKKIAIAAAFLTLSAGMVSCGAKTDGTSAAAEPAQAADDDQAATDSAQVTEPTDGAKLVILHTNDIHGYMTPSQHCLGIAAIAQLKKDYEQKGCDVLLLDAGDMLQGNSFAGLFQGESVVKVMNAAGYDAAALGNHDFDYGADVLEQRMKEMNFPALAANITVDATGEPFAQGHTIFTLSDGMKIGVFGLDTPSTKTTSSPKNTAGLSFAAGEEMFAAAQAQIDELKAQGCSEIICLGHLGEEEMNRGNTAADVVQNTKGISVLINGHDHQVENQTVQDMEGNDVLIVESGYYLRGVGVLTYEDGKFAESLVEAGTYEGSEPDLSEMVAEINEKIEASLGEISAVTEFDLNSAGNAGGMDTESNLGDFVTDAIYWQVSQANGTAPDGVVLNSGAIRSPLKAGDISLLDIRNMFPFNNQLCTIELTGAQLLESLEAATQTEPMSSSAFPQVSGIKYTLDVSVPYEKGELYPGTTFYAPAAPGSRITITEVGGKAFDPDAVYTIATIDFLAYGGDTYYCFAEAASRTRKDAGYLDYEAIVNYMKTELGGTIPNIYEETQGRITVVGDE